MLVMEADEGKFKFLTPKGHLYGTVLLVDFGVCFGSGNTYFTLVLTICIIVWQIVRQFSSSTRRILLQGVEEAPCEWDLSAWAY